MTHFRKDIPCGMSGCPNLVWSRGLCITHYSRLRNHGDPNVVLPRRPPPVNTRDKRVRFEEKIRHSDHATDGCCIWIGSRNTFGYGQLRTGARGLLEMAHRLAWGYERGPIPDGLLVLHHCDNPPCVRPDHLFLGDQKANAADRQRKGRQNRQAGDLRHTVPTKANGRWRPKYSRHPKG